MSFGQGMARGAGIASSIPRPKMQTMRFTAAPPRRLAPQQQQKEAPRQLQAAPQQQSMEPKHYRESAGVIGSDPESLAMAREQNRYHDGQIDQAKQEHDTKIQGIIGKDYDMSVAALSVGDTKLAEDFINTHGNKEARVSIKANDKGGLTVTPESTGKAMEFPDQRSFYSSFFAAFKPPGSGYEQPEAPKQEWGQIADGTRILDKHSGKIKETGYSKDGAGGYGSTGSGSTKASKTGTNPAMDQIDTYILNRVMARMNEAGTTGADGGPISINLKDGDDSNEGKKIDFDRIKQNMTPEEVNAYNLAMTSTHQMLQEGGQPHIVANQAFKGFQEMVEGQGNKEHARRLTDQRQGGQGQGQQRTLAPAGAQEAPAPTQGQQQHPAAKIPADAAGIKQLSAYLGSLPQHGDAREKELNELAEINPDLVIAYYESLKKSGQGVHVKQAGNDSGRIPVQPRQ